ncbi:MAG: NAD(P)/FAD-dependent oxidoreductase [Candidatus Omnitrophica bacterium]|nr:NAD(P)/FAD-dependent oxidoreductase [Candidatus Omnitrophota bacterium]
MPKLQSNHYDVIIVGGGPAGLACADQLRSSSLSCLIIEKHQSFGQKVCAGGLTYLADSLNLPQDKICIFKHNYYFLNHKYHDIKLAHSIKTIDRPELSSIQYHRIQSAPNVQVLFNSTVLKVEGNCVLTQNNKFSYQYLIGADGAGSIVRKHLGLKTQGRMGIYAMVRNASSRLIWHLDYKKLYSGYLWEFPHQTHTNVGVLFSPEQLNASRAEVILKEYIHDKNYEIINGQFMRGFMNCYYQGNLFGDIFLVGEAAGLVSKLTGEGISFAIISGTEIAKKIIDKNYDLHGLQQALKYKKRQDFFWAISNYLPLFRPLTYPLFVALMKKTWFQRFYGL